MILSKQSYRPAIIFFGAVVLALAGCKEETPIDGPKHGPQWLVYTTANSPLVSDTIYTIEVDDAGVVWFGTENGVGKYDRGGWSRIQEPLEFPNPVNPSFVSRRVNAITFGSDGSLWVGLPGGGVRRKSPVQVEWERHDSLVLPSMLVYSLATDRSGEIWIGSSAGVTRHVPGSPSAPGRWRNYTSGNSPLPDEPVRSLEVNPFNNTIWFGTSSQGIVMYDGDFDWNISAPADPSLPVLAIGFTRSNTALVAMYADYAYEFSLSTLEWTHLATSAGGGGLPSSVVNAVASDLRNGVNYFGTNAGLTKSDHGSWYTWTRANSPLPSDTIASLAFDAKWNLWIGTTRGMVKYREGGTIP